MAEHRALIVEDSEPMTRLMSGLLKSIRGLSVEFARDGIEALKRIKQHSFDLILTDLEMPILNGTQFIGKLRQYPQYSATPVIVVTAENSAQQREAARRAGASAFLAKPLQGASLLETVKRFLQPQAAASVVPTPILATASPAPEVQESRPVGFKVSVPAGDATTSPQKHKILVCDDDPTLQRLMVSFIATTIGATVRSVGDGAAAMETLDSFAPDVLVLDMMMPKMNGTQVLEALNMRRAEGKPTPKVLVYSAIDLRRDVMRKGAHGFLQKPGNIDQIRDAIVDVINAPAAPAQTAFATGFGR